ncbi:hypothetical protein ACHAXS_000486, partial [Conticribra weissflogii]
MMTQKHTKNCDENTSFTSQKSIKRSVIHIPKTGASRIHALVEVPPRQESGATRLQTVEEP